MTPEYREPDYRLMEHKLEIQASFILVAVTGLVAMVKGDNPVNVIGILIVFTAVMGYSWIYQRWTPKIGDYLDYLEQRSREDGQYEWLDEVNRSFHVLWKIDIRRDLEEALVE